MGTQMRKFELLSTNDIPLGVDYESLKGMARNLKLAARGRKLTGAEQEDLVMINNVIAKHEEQFKDGKSNKKSAV